jgi:hypothetical protein
MHAPESPGPQPGGSTPAQALLGVCRAWSDMTPAERSDVRLLGQPVRATAALVEEARRWGDGDEIEALDELLASRRIVVTDGRPDPCAIMRQHGPGKRSGKRGKRK